MASIMSQVLDAMGEDGYITSTAHPLLFWVLFYGHLADTQLQKSPIYGYSGLWRRCKICKGQLPARIAHHSRSF